MGFRTWFMSRLAQADLANLGVILVFAALLGAGSVAAMVNPDEGPNRVVSDEMGPFQVDDGPTGQEGLEVVTEPQSGHERGKGEKRDPRDEDDH